MGRKGSNLWISSGRVVDRGSRAVCDTDPVDSAAPTFPPEPWTSAEVPEPPPDGDLGFACPRCGSETLAHTYAPCPSCRSDLRARLDGEKREVATEDYVPKMNVTPNAVALKD